MLPARIIAAIKTRNARVENNADKKSVLFSPFFSFLHFFSAASAPLCLSLAHRKALTPPREPAGTSARARRLRRLLPFPWKHSVQKRA